MQLDTPAKDALIWIRNACAKARGSAKRRRIRRRVWPLVTFSAIVTPGSPAYKMRSRSARARLRAWATEPRGDMLRSYDFVRYREGAIMTQQTRIMTQQTSMKASEVRDNWS